MNISFNPLVRVRTVTAFVNLSADEAQWQAGLTQAKQQCDAVADAIEARGYQVQSIRIVSNPFGEYLDVSSADSALAGLQHIAETLKTINTGKRRIRFADHCLGCTAGSGRLSPNRTTSGRRVPPQ